jgi:hypothetical protein
MHLFVFVAESQDGLRDFLIDRDASRVNCGRQKYWFGMW